jgi:hypothetical protein
MAAYEIRRPPTQSARGKSGFAGLYEVMKGEIMMIPLVKELNPEKAETYTKLITVMVALAAVTAILCTVVQMFCFFSHRNDCCCDNYDDFDSDDDFGDKD